MNQNSPNSNLNKSNHEMNLLPSGINLAEEIVSSKNISKSQLNLRNSSLGKSKKSFRKKTHTNKSNHIISQGSNPEKVIESKIKFGQV
jgi:hypothetical protein